MEVAAGIWGFSNRDKVNVCVNINLAVGSVSVVVSHSKLNVYYLFCLQVVEDLTEFYKQTYTNYKDTKQEALKETLRLIHFGVRTHIRAFTR